MAIFFCATQNKDLLNTNLGDKAWIKCLLITKPLLETCFYERNLY